MEPYFTEKVRHELEVMYKGDKARDASNKIRGFLFQDLVAIEFLLEEQVQYVFLEFLEDVDVAYEDGRFKIIQIKYHPKTNPNMKEITTDLYYQYLRFDLSNGKAEEDNEIKLKPQLIIHRNEEVLKPDSVKMKEYIGTFLAEKPNSLMDIEEQLKTVIPTLKKEEQKKRVFSNWAYEQSVLNFLSDFSIIKKSRIEKFQNEIENKLEKNFPPSSIYGIQKHRGKILMGLAIIFIQERYKAEKAGFSDILIRKTDFEDFIQSNTALYSDKSIIAYISAIAAEEFEAIIAENEKLSDDQRKLLNTIYRNTIEWVSETCGDVEGQFRIVNTLSSGTHEQVSKFLDCDASERLLEIAGCKENLKIFFRYLWKIIFDICSELKPFDLQKDADMLKPQKYIVKSKTKYICLHFPQDCVETSVILPPAYGTFNSKKKNHWLRLMEEKPRKWFMECDSRFAGKHEYDYSTAKIVENDSVIDLDRDGFTIECMQCVKIDEDEWTEIDDCENCIFAEKCIERKHE